MNDVAWVFEQGGWVSIALAFVSLCLWTAMAVRLMTLWPSKNPAGRDASGGFSAVAQFQNELGRGALSPDRLKRLVERTGRRLGSMRDAIRTLVTIAPLLGLLGTVIGMVEMFGSLQGALGSGGESTVAGGISTALVTTQLGLVIAAPGLLVAYWLDRQQLRREREVEAWVSAHEEARR